MNSREVLPVFLPSFHLLGATDSTNEEAMRLYRSGQRVPLWICAEEQSAGRGRHGRSWYSPKGNLYATLFAGFPIPISKAGHLTFVAALAMHETIYHYLKTCFPENRILLKWPNDVLVENRKISGILLEHIDFSKEGECFLAIGCGLNLRSFPLQARTPSACLADFISSPPSPHEALTLLAAFFDKWLRVWEFGARFDQIRTAWLRHGWALKHPIALRIGNEFLQGSFEGLAEDGALIIQREDGQRQTIHSGEIELTVREMYRKTEPIDQI